VVSLLLLLLVLSVSVTSEDGGGDVGGVMVMSDSPVSRDTTFVLCESRFMILTD